MGGYALKTITGINAVTGGTTDAVLIDDNRGVTVQQTAAATGTATIEVSIKGVVFVQFHPASTAYDLTRAVVIADGHFPWRYMRMVIAPGGTGVPVFEINATLP